MTSVGIDLHLRPGEWIFSTVCGDSETSVLAL